MNIVISNMSSSAQELIVFMVNFMLLHCAHILVIDNVAHQQQEMDEEIDSTFVAFYSTCILFDMVTHVDERIDLTCDPVCSIT